MQARHFGDSAVKTTNKIESESFVTFGDIPMATKYLWRQHKNKSQTDCVEEREANAIKGNVTVPVERNNLFLFSCKLQSYPSVQAQEAHIEARQVLLASWAVNEIQIFDSNFSSGTSSYHNIMNALTGSSGLSGAGLDSEKVKIEHVFVFQIDSKLERPFRRIVETALKLSYHWAESFRIVGIGLAAYLVLLGTSKLIETIKQPRQIDNDNNNDNLKKKKSSRSSGGSSSSGSSSGGGGGGVHKKKPSRSRGGSVEKSRTTASSSTTTTTTAKTASSEGAASEAASSTVATLPPSKGDTDGTIAEQHQDVEQLQDEEGGGEEERKEEDDDDDEGRTDLDA